MTEQAVRGRISQRGIHAYKAAPHPRVQPIDLRELAGDRIRLTAKTDGRSRFSRRLFSQVAELVHVRVRPRKRPMSAEERERRAKVLERARRQQAYLAQGRDISG